MSGIVLRALIAGVCAFSMLGCKGGSDGAAEQTTKPTTTEASKSSADAGSNAADDPAGSAQPPPPVDPPATVEDAITAARPTVADAAARAIAPSAEDITRHFSAVDPSDRERIRIVVRIATTLDEPVAADRYLDLIARLESAGDFELARTVAIAGERKHLADPRWVTTLDRLLDTDPKYAPAVRTLVADVDVDAIKYLGGGSTIVVRLIKDKSTFAAFKPLQTRLQSNYRSEIAAWRICPLIRCGFAIPYNAPGRITWRSFDGLFSRISSAKQKAYRENLSDLKFVKEDDEDWVYGTVKDWVPSFTKLPVEISQFWRPWMLQENDPSNMDGRAQEVVDTIRKIHPNGERIGNELTMHMADMEKRELARQISNMIAYDFLINNWDRFSGAKDFWGVNCQFANQEIVSIDNGASFAKTPNANPKKQLERVQRFSRQLVKAVRALDRDRTTKRLFPDASEYELVRLETFWAQREAFLAYVDGLIATHGEDQVLYFE